MSEWAIVGGRRHRVLCERPCACGCEQMVRVTSNRPQQKFLNYAHVREHYATGLDAARQRRMQREREAKWGTLIDALLADRRVTRAKLLALCQEVYGRAYNTAMSGRANKARRAA